MRRSERESSSGSRGGGDVRRWWKGDGGRRSVNDGRCWREKRREEMTELTEEGY